MLPVQRIAAVVGEYSAAFGEASLGTLPAGLRLGDHLFMIVALASSSIALDTGASDNIVGWVEYLNLSNTGNRIIVYRRIADADTNLIDGPSFVFDTLAIKGACAFLAYRTPDSAGVVASGVVTPAGGSSGTFTTPTLNLARYSDLYIGAVFYRGDDPAPAADAGPIVQVPVDGGDNLGILLVYEYVPEAAGASGTHAITYEGSAIANYGAAIAFVMSSPPVGTAPTFALDPYGTIGLPVKGI